MSQDPAWVTLFQNLVSLTPRPPSWPYASMSLHRNSQLADCDISPRRTPSGTLISVLAMRSSLFRSWSSLILTILHGSASARLQLSGSLARWRSTQLVRVRNTGWGDPGEDTSRNSNRRSRHQCAVHRYVLTIEPLPRPQRLTPEIQPSRSQRWCPITARARPAQETSPDRWQCWNAFRRRRSERTAPQSTVRHLFDWS